MVEIGIVLGSTRPGRNGAAVARWIAQVCGSHPLVLEGHARVSSIDVQDFGLPLLDERTPPLIGAPERAHSRRWAEAMRPLDGFVFVTPEYNHSIPAALKNAVDFLFHEWNDKAATVVGYGAQGGVRAIEHLRGILAEVKIATTRAHVALSLHDDFRFEDPTRTGEFLPRPHQAAELTEAFGEVFEWAAALARLREERRSGGRP